MNRAPMKIRKRLFLLAGGLIILTGMAGLSLRSPLSAAGREGLRGMPLHAGEPGIERWKTELGLSGQQIEQLRGMREELRRERADKTLRHAAIDLELSDEQVAALKEMHEKHRGQRDAMREKHREELEALQKKAGLTDEQVAGLGMMAREGRRAGAGMNLMRRGRGYARLAGEADEIRDRLSKILTEEQMQKLDEMREEHRDKRCDESTGEGRGGRPHRRPRCERDD